MKEIDDATVIVARFPNPMLFVLSLLRVSEFKECLKHSNIIFSLGNYRKWFRGQHEGYDYEDYVLGMNLPDVNFKNFFEAFSTEKGVNKVNRFEQQFIKMLQKNKLVKVKGSKLNILKKFYVIVLNEFLIDSNMLNEEVTMDVEEATLRHEISHALFYVSQEYKDIVSKSWNALDEDAKASITEFLKAKFYTEDVFVDEFGAYTCESCDNVFPIDRVKYKKQVSAIEKYFNNKVDGI